MRPRTTAAPAAHNNHLRGLAALGKPTPALSAADPWIRAHDEEMADLTGDLVLERVRQATVCGYTDEHDNTRHPFDWTQTVIALANQALRHDEFRVRMVQIAAVALAAAAAYDRGYARYRGRPDREEGGQ